MFLLYFTNKQVMLCLLIQIVHYFNIKVDSNYARMISQKSSLKKCMLYSISQCSFTELLLMFCY